MGVSGVLELSKLQCGNPSTSASANHTEQRLSLDREFSGREVGVTVADIAGDGTTVGSGLMLMWIEDEKMVVVESARGDHEMRLTVWADSTLIGISK
jgi:hypothetical protein